MACCPVLLASMAASSLLTGMLCELLSIFLLQHSRSDCPTAPLAGPAAWRAVTLAWAAKLEQQLGEPHLAALHLLAVQEVEGAVQVRRNRGPGIGGGAPAWVGAAIGGNITITPWGAQRCVWTRLLQQGCLCTQLWMGGPEFRLPPFCPRFPGVPPSGLAA